MKVIKSSVEIINQEPGIIGMKKHIERVGRISYKSEGKITENSYEKFIEMLYSRGHWAVFNLGTVYLKFSGKDVDFARLYSIFREHPFSKIRNIGNDYYVTTDFRVICQFKLEKDMEKYWCDPTPNHYLKVTTHWICSRSTSHQIIRHSSLRPIQESQRYVNYCLDKNGNGITYILPQWAYDVRDEIGSTVDSLTGMSREYIYDLDGEELWEELCILDRTVASRDNLWKAIETEYFNEINSEDGEKLKPEDARGVLCNDTKTELCLTGYVSDWWYDESKNPDSPEKCGFFNLRMAPDAQRDVRVLAKDLYNQFIEAGLI